MMISSAKEIIDDIRQGKMVILMDDEDRENEGDLIIASQHITPEAINFMATNGRGLICLTLSKTRCQKLGLPLMVQDNTEQFGTPFTISIEAATGVTTGISAADRSRTVQAAVAADATAADIVMPGHIFPLMAQEGGVLTRAGHTEAGCDVARLAGLEASSVIVEILNDDGTMARRPQLEVFAEKHGLKLGTIADLIEYRNLHETTIERVGECKLNTEFGEFDMITYRDKIDDQIHYALRKGDVEENAATLVRVHLQDIFKDILQSGATQWTLPAAMQRISAENGVLVVLSKQESTDSIVNKVKNIAAENEGRPQVKANPYNPSRQVGIGSQILSDLGIGKMRLLSSSTQRYHSLSGFGLEVVEYICE
ncbi:bifunctional 3,4-dihydroxy-2-butanone-4-phosphate synthase/GTP cyclohydrolase II [uncultured Photobacterium sp.]|uniref:bifunctional 3,4-dihydroxy-2-butanone-4-phosphate synthase/GTP cyclohydrolase II n=1 Tax=uncultured Photobacterium sp. TaxID=173973 RepID=UPI002615EDC9|nr:bifunctional 3,4-dihydroxy-2-butanone-4-phosphate synthase/GTP cyclohydrolase II [uncultured Photobacterium sp.]